MTITSAGPSGSAVAARLGRFYLLSRRIPGALAALAGSAVVLHLVLHWTPASGAYAVQLPLLIIGAAAAAIGAAMRSPFDESERATGVRLPLLRLSAGTALTALAYGSLAAGCAGAHLTFGAVGLLRDLAGVVGVTLLTAAFASGNLAWLGTLSYLLLAMTAVAVGWTTPWMWPARPPTDTGAAICAALTFVGGVVAITILGAHETARD